MPAKASNKLPKPHDRMDKILPILKKLYPDAQCSLDHATPLQLLVATILSAQCTDERVNIVTRHLFAKYPDAQSLASASQEQLEGDIQSTGFFRNKAKALRTMAAILTEEYQGQVPRTMEQLVELPGVGRKTANVVLGNAFGINTGIVVDTHVGRLSQRLGLTKHTDPVKVEKDLCQLVPPEDWTIFSHLLIFHGRKLCNARKPQCLRCPLLEYCPTGKKNVLSTHIKSLE